MVDFTLINDQIAELWRTHRMTLDRVLADRIKAVFLLGTGGKPEKIVEALLIGEKTVRNYFFKYKSESGEMDVLLSMAWQGGVSRLTREQEEELYQHLDEHLHHASKEIVKHIKKACGFCIRLAALTRF